MTNKEVCAAINARPVKSWAMQASGELNRREDAIYRAAISLRIALNAESFFRCLDDATIVKLQDAETAAKIAIEELRIRRAAVWELRFSDRE